MRPPHHDDCLDLTCQPGISSCDTVRHQPWHQPRPGTLQPRPPRVCLSLSILHIPNPIPGFHCPSLFLPLFLAFHPRRSGSPPTVYPGDPLGTWRFFEGFSNKWSNISFVEFALFFISLTFLWHRSGRAERSDIEQHLCTKKEATAGGFLGWKCEVAGVGCGVLSNCPSGSSSPFDIRHIRKQRI